MVTPPPSDFSEGAVGGDRIRLLARAAGSAGSDDMVLADLDGRHWTFETAKAFTGRTFGVYAVDREVLVHTAFLPSLRLRALELQLAVGSLPWFPIRLVRSREGRRPVRMGFGSCSWHAKEAQDVDLSTPQPDVRQAAESLSE